MRPDLAGNNLLAADVGGTNLNLALLDPQLRILRQERFSTQGEASLEAAAQRFLATCAEAGLTAPGLGCAAGAGPVRGRRIQLTNAPWAIDGGDLERALGFPMRVINDFTAVSYGVLRLDPGDPAQLLPLPHPGGPAQADPQGTVLIVGAGTGLGAGFVTRGPGGPRAFASEGGHVGLPILSETTLALWRHLRAGLPGPPGAELAVSGPGLARILAFLLDTGRAAPSDRTRAILALPAAERPAAVGAGGDPACERALDLFVDLYARVCAELCAAFLPTGGLFLAGGIAARHGERFLAGDRFMAAFETNYLEHLDALNRSIPVHIVRDYAISLYGAAHAACLPEP